MGTGLIEKIVFDAAVAVVESPQLLCIDIVVVI